MAEQRRPNGATTALGIISLIVATLSLLVCWIPLLGMVAVPGGAIAVILAIIGVAIACVDGLRGIVMPAIGGFLGVLAIVVAMGVTGGTAVLLDEEIRRQQAEQERQQQHQQTEQPAPDTSPTDGPDAP